MFPLDLTAAEKRAYRAAQAASASMRVRTSVLTLDHERVGVLDQELLDGQVDVKATAARSISLVFNDRRRAISFGSDSPSDGALFGARMIQAEYGIKVPTIGWVDVPVFTGPIRILHRHNGMTFVDAVSKETRLQVPAFRPLSIPRGTLKVDAIKKILAFYGGETRVVFPDLEARLPRDVSLGRDTIPWRIAQRIAESMNRQLFCDGAGWFRLRRFPGNPVLTFRDGTGGLLTEPVDVGYDITKVRNVIIVRAGKPRGGKGKRIRRIATADRDHALSPWSLAMNDTPHYLKEVRENRHIRSEEEAQEFADRLLADRLRQHVTLEYSSMVVPDLEARDLLRVDSTYGDTGVEHRAPDFTIPLKVEETMTIGFTKKVSIQRPHRGRRRR